MKILIFSKLILSLNKEFLCLYGVNINFENLINRIKKENKIVFVLTLLSLTIYLWGI